MMKLENSYSSNSSGGESLDDKYNKAMFSIDQSGLLIYILVATILGILVYIFGIVQENWFVVLIIMIIFIVINFLVLFFLSVIVQDKLTNLSFADGYFKKHYITNEDFDDAALDPLFLCIFVATAIVIGTCITYAYNMFRVKAMTNSVTNLDTYNDMIWITDFFSRLIVGLLAYFLQDRVREHVFGIIGCI